MLLSRSSRSGPEPELFQNSTFLVRLWVEISPPPHPQKLTKNGEIIVGETIKKLKGDKNIFGAQNICFVQKFTNVTKTHVSGTSKGCFEIMGWQEDLWLGWKSRKFAEFSHFRTIWSKQTYVRAIFMKIHTHTTRLRPQPQPKLWWPLTWGKTRHRLKNK